ncbi:hypothetical protein CABS01_04980 [Colletotrichum abscissum]|uniref:Uncharacterized protein n=3 Tax=Colletotrichum acutatum species complex TaxID=2707335 RepID=A0A9Q8SQY9_9PEZI|nr:uncharacterized protein CLUP02_06458 [Colletotrichum lupini]XP_060313543.1 uncharacterized protein CCOS01_07486 [Colletotrichum costaricense]XP_060381824.1 uncharacterized protein CTAM01_07425 [Colletotrichum tamarilloi]XP_060405522.1 uncharacterized protein CABS01_04980 [Colletotrichum abscissum]KAK1498207.1 hypothetical protein CTAM01_07425 [Colletotrichum tamarilloi]KAK1523359.1 hypothetical protein CABS01_04980 [Colletotrichum abscissum]KAK1527224.1 hypothetical protein CCOS01_07486 [C
MNGQLEEVDLSKSRLAGLRSLQHMAISDGGGDRRNMAYQVAKLTFGAKENTRKKKRPQIWIQQLRKTALCSVYRFW